MNKNLIAVAIAALLVGGVAVAAYNSFTAPGAEATVEAPALDLSGQAGLDLQADAGADGAIAPAAGPEYADVVNVIPVTEQRERFATVIGTDPIRETTSSSTPRQVCEDVVVQERLPERDGNVGGTVAGAVVGGLLGNQVGGGSGKKVATAAGAVAGGYVGNRMDRNHVGGRVVERVETQCHTVNESSQSTAVVGYNVTYRTPDGETATMRTGSKPGERISLGNEDQVVGYDVTYRYQGLERSVRMNDRPGERLPVMDGEVVLQTAALESASNQ